MAILKLQPRNLPGIEKHFAQRKKELKTKLASVIKKKIEIERELEIAEDGHEWCKKVYEASKTKTVKAKANG